MMKIRKTKLDEIDEVSGILEQARHFMQNTGNENQWINGYPSKELIISDIHKGNSYVCLNDGGEIAGVFCFIEGEEITYARIENGKWLNDEPYGVIHRLAGKTGEKGVANACLNRCFERCKNLRIDTHRDNFIMQNILKNSGFSYCGIIYVANGSERLAFQKSEI